MYYSKGDAIGTRGRRHGVSLVMTFSVILTVILLALTESGLATTPCFSTRHGCSDSDLEATTVSECCAQPQALSYLPTSDSETCSLCYAYGWVRDIAEDSSSAEPQCNVTVVEGHNITLNVFFSKNGHLSGFNTNFDLTISGTATENVDYRLIYDEPLVLGNDKLPTPVTVAVLNDRLCGEGVENVTLTLTYNQAFVDMHGLNGNELLLHDTVTINILDNTITTGFSRTEVNITEGTEGEVCLMTHGEPALDTAIGVTLIPGTARANDLTVLTKQVMVTDRDPEPCVKFTAPAEGSAEVRERAVLKLSAPDNVLLTPDTLTIFIEDSDGGVKGGFLCSKESSCSGSFVEADSVEDCCLTKGALTYQSNTGMCSQCIVGKVNQEETNDGGSSSSHLEIILPIVAVLVLLIALLIGTALVVAYAVHQKKKKEQQSEENDTL